MFELVLIGLILFCAFYIYCFLAKRYSIVDIPNSRSSHNKVTVRGGGIIFPFSVILYYFFYNSIDFYFVIGLVLISLISFIDDIKSISPIVRLLFHFVSLTFLILSNNVNGFEHPVIFLLLFLGAVAFLNAFNFMDGINGITGFYSLSILIPCLLLSYFNEITIDPKYLLLIIISVLIFGFFNFRKKALAFAGDVGSISLSYIITDLLLKLILPVSDGNFSLNSLYFLIFISVYCIDSFITILIRIGKGENILKPHRKHLYQLMANELKFPHLIVAAGFALSQFIINCIVILQKPNFSIFVLIIIFLVSVYLIVRQFILKRLKND